MGVGKKCFDGACCVRPAKMEHAMFGLRRRTMGQTTVKATSPCLFNGQRCVINVDTVLHSRMDGWTWSWARQGGSTYDNLGTTPSERIVQQPA